MCGCCKVYAFYLNDHLFEWFSVNIELWELKSVDGTEEKDHPCI